MIGVYLNFKDMAVPARLIFGVDIVSAVLREGKWLLAVQNLVFNVLAFASLEGRRQHSPLPVLEYAHGRGTPTVEASQWLREALVVAFAAELENAGTGINFAQRQILIRDTLFDEASDVSKLVSESQKAENLLVRPTAANLVCKLLDLGTAEHSEAAPPFKLLKYVSVVDECCES